MSWLSAFPDVLACVLLFFGPGLLVTYLGGLRGITAWATAPLITVAVVAAVAVLGGLLGFRFGVWPVVAVTAVVAGLALALALRLRARGMERPPQDPQRYSLAVVAGAVAAAAVGEVTFVTGVRSPSAIDEFTDDIFHYNAVRYIEQTGRASPLTIGSLGQPGGRGAFYPDAWHAMTALVAELTHAPITVASSVTCLVVAVLVWPLSCLLLARHLFGAADGRATAAAVSTGMLSSLFAAFPWILTSEPWPNALGMALAPAGVALGMSMTSISAGDTFGPQRWFFGLLGAWAIGIAHPVAAVSVALICLAPVLMRVGPSLTSWYRRHRAGTTLVVLALVAVAAIGASVAKGLPPVRTLLETVWPPFENPGQATINGFTFGTDRQAAEWPLAAFSLIGAIACFVRRQRRWLVLAECAIVALYVGSAASGSPFARLFTGLWYDDSNRIAAMLPVVAIPLATMGVLAAAEWLQPWLQRMVRRRLAAVAAAPGLAFSVPLVLGTVLAVATAAQSVPRNAHTVGARFSTSGYYVLVGPAKLQFFHDVARLVPHSALVADNPADGTAYLWTLTGIRVLFPQWGITSNNKEMTYLAGSLVRLGENSRTCDLVRRYDIGYMIIAPEYFGPLAFYSGVTSPDGRPGFRLIARDGPMKLYKITICQPGRRASGPAEAASRPKHGRARAPLAFGVAKLPVDFRAESSR